MAFEVKKDMEGIYKSSAPLLLEDFKVLKQLGITSIITLNVKSYMGVARRPEMRAANRFRSAKFSNLYLPIPPQGGVPTPKDVALFTYFVDGVLAKGGKVLVHCSRGIGRTKTMLLAYKITNGIIPPEEAHLHTRTLEFPGQKEFIERFAKETMPGVKRMLSREQRLPRKKGTARKLPKRPKPRKPRSR